MPSLLTKSFVIMATLAIGITLGNVVSHVSPTIQTGWPRQALLGAERRKSRGSLLAYPQRGRRPMVSMKVPTE